MSLPIITPYDLPQLGDYPPSKAQWSADPRRSALLIHDLQEYFLRPFDRNQTPIVPVLENIKRLRELCEHFLIPVFFSAQPGEQDRKERGLLWDIWGAGIINAKELSGFPSGVEPGPYNYRIVKRRYSAFRGTDLQGQLSEMGRDQLIVTGIYGHIGCHATCLDAFMLDIQPFLVADAMADFSLHDHIIALRQVARTCGVVTATGDLLLTLAEQQITSLVPQLLEDPKLVVAPDDELLDLGLDSIRQMMLFERVLLPEPQPEFEELIEARSVRELARLLVAQLQVQELRVKNEAAE